MSELFKFWINFPDYFFFDIWKVWVSLLYDVYSSFSSIKEIFLVIKIIKKYLKWKIRWRKFYYYWKIIEPYLVVNRFRLSYIWKFIFIFKIQTNISNTWLDITFIYIFFWRKWKFIIMGFGPEMKRECPVLFFI